MKAEKKTSYDKGLWAEKIAALHLMARGYKVLRERYKTKVGEIDIVARQENVIVFIEVKIRPSIDEALFSISQKARQRIERAAETFLSEHTEYATSDARFDVIAIKGTPPFSLTHLDNAWQTGS